MPAEEKDGRWNNGNKGKQEQYSLKLQTLFQKLTHTLLHQNPVNNLETRTEERKQAKGYSDGPRTCCDLYVVFSCCNHETILSVMRLF